MVKRLGKREKEFVAGPSSDEDASFSTDPPMRPRRHVEFQPISSTELKEWFKAQTLNLDALKIDLASIYYCQGQYWLAEAIQEKFLQASKENADVDVACIMHDLAQTYQMQGRLQQAKDIALEAERLKKALLGSDDPSSRHTEALLKRIENSIHSSRHICGRVTTMLEEAGWMVWR
jgi:tetratricopeptide (TPR) repeat protein